jgi:imidazolonepropionase-like amidohydrolase
LNLRKQIDAGELLGPRILVPRAAYFAIADEAKRSNIPFAGHVPESVSALEASDVGQRSIEHLSGVRLACSTDETELRQELIDARAKSDASLLYRALRHVYVKSKETYSAEKAEVLFARFVANHTWQVPTLVVARFVAQINKNPKQSRVAALQTSDVLKNNPRPTELTGDEFESVSTTTQNTFDLVSAVTRTGVRFMAGTDSPNPFVVPGRSLHDELELLVQAGFTPLEALQCATRNPAEYLGRLDTVGTVEKGKIADLVLLDADPLEDIGISTTADTYVHMDRTVAGNGTQVLADAILANCDLTVTQDVEKAA